MFHFFEALGLPETVWLFVFYDATFGEQSPLTIPQRFLVKRFPCAVGTPTVMLWIVKEAHVGVFLLPWHMPGNDVNAKRLRLNLGK